MPRFYINFRNGDEIAQDREGTELPSLEAAKELAMNSARELLADSVKTGSKSLLRPTRGQRRLDGHRLVFAKSHESEIWSILQQHAPIGHALAEVFHLAVDSQLNPAQHLQLKAGGCHDDIGLQLAAGFQRDATFRKGLDVIRDD